MITRVSSERQAIGSGSRRCANSVTLGGACFPSEQRSEHSSIVPSNKPKASHPLKGSVEGFGERLGGTNAAWTCQDTHQTIPARPVNPHNVHHIEPSTLLPRARSRQLTDCTIKAACFLVCLLVQCRPIRGLVEGNWMNSPKNAQSHLFATANRSRIAAVTPVLLQFQFVDMHPAYQFVRCATLAAITRATLAAELKYHTPSILICLQKMDQIPQSHVFVLRARSICLTFARFDRAFAGAALCPSLEESSRLESAGPSVDTAGFSAIAIEGEGFALDAVSTNTSILSGHHAAGSRFRWILCSENLVLASATNCLVKSMHLVSWTMIARQDYPWRSCWAFITRSIVYSSGTTKLSENNISLPII